MQQKKFVTTDTLFARIEENLSKYTNVGVLDVGKFYQQVKLMSQRLGLEMYIPDEDLLYLKDGRAEMPCNFYSLDSAWLCNHQDYENGIAMRNQQGITHQWYEEITTDCVKQDLSCGTISSCSDKVLNRITTREYVVAPPPVSLNNGQAGIRFHRPKLLTINDGKTRDLCEKKCANLFPSSPWEIWIRNGQLHSELKDPVIYIRYWGYPVDDKTGLPLIVDDEIIINAIEWHLMHYFFQMLYLNYPEQSLVQRLQYLEGEKNKAFAEAESYIKLPSFRKLTEVVKMYRHSWQTYQLNFYHY